MDKQKLILFSLFFFTFFIQLFSSQTPPARKRSHTTSSPLGQRRRAESDPAAVWRAKQDARIKALEEETQRRLDALEELMFGGAPLNTRPDSEGGDTVPQWYNVKVLLKGMRRESVVDVPVTESVTYYRKKTGGEWKRLPKGAHKSPERYEFETRKEMAFDRQCRPKGSSDPWQLCDDDHDDTKCEYRVTPRTCQVSHIDETLPSLMLFLRQQHEDYLELRARLAAVEAKHSVMQRELEKKEVLAERPESKYPGQGSPRRPTRQPSIRGSARDFWRKVLPSIHNADFGVAGQRAQKFSRNGSSVKLPAIVGV